MHGGLTHLVKLTKLKKNKKDVSGKKWIFALWSNSNFPFKILQCLGGRVPASLWSTTLHLTFAPDIWRGTDGKYLIPEDMHSLFHPVLLWICAHSEFFLCVKAIKKQKTKKPENFICASKVLNGYVTEHPMEILYSSCLLYPLSMLVISEVK